jgi:hypothetical protein
MITLTPQQKLWELGFGPIIRAEFAKLSLPPAWGMAIACFESQFNPHALADTGGDAGRGCAWGLCQMTLETAREMGYLGEPEGLYNPHINAALAAKLCQGNMRRVGNEIRDVYAAYNSGRPYNKAPARTRAKADIVEALATKYASDRRQ